MTDLREQIAKAVRNGFAQSCIKNISDYETADAILELLKGAVKPLEWEWPTEYGLICRAKTSIGTYSIHNDEDSAGSALFMYLHLTDDGDCTKYAIGWHGYFEPDEFQAIAQADCERRILAALGVK
ncbi:hypothetical protein [Pseudophaeobacter sp. 1A09344]|uniref:hypothetical protein n=1 Tax=Pseudophaeobacter sp. 1A09344 TaxID=3098144 RepID=UPI0034D53081